MYNTPSQAQIAKVRPDYFNCSAHFIVNLPSTATTVFLHYVFTVENVNSLIHSEDGTLSTAILFSNLEH